MNHKHHPVPRGHLCPHEGIAAALRWLHDQAREANLPAASLSAIADAAELCAAAPYLADEEAKGIVMSRA